MHSGALMVHGGAHRCALALGCPPALCMHAILIIERLGFFFQHGCVAPAVGFQNPGSLTPQPEFGQAMCKPKDWGAGCTGGAHVGNWVCTCVHCTHSMDTMRAHLRPSLRTCSAHLRNADVHMLSALCARDVLVLH